MPGLALSKLQGLLGGFINHIIEIEQGNQISIGALPDGPNCRAQVNQADYRRKLAKFGKRHPLDFLGLFDSETAGPTSQVNQDELSGRIGRWGGHQFEQLSQVKDRYTAKFAQEAAELGQGRVCGRLQPGIIKVAQVKLPVAAQAEPLTGYPEKQDFKARL